MIAPRSSTWVRLLSRLPKSESWLRLRVDQMASITDADLAERAYRQISIGNGITKQTAPARFADLDEVVCRLVGASSRLRVHDVGVSSGITSLELHTRLAAIRELHFFVSDRFARFRVTRSAYGVLIRDANDEVLCGYAGPIYCDPATPRKYVISQLAYRQLLRAPVIEETTLLLFDPGLMALIDSGEVSFIDFDVLATAATAQKFDFVRCMNLLNLSYFTEPQIRQGIVNLASTLAPGAWLQIGRTHTDGSNHATFYVNDDGILRVVDRMGDGSEIEHLVSVPDPAVQAHHLR